MLQRREEAMTMQHDLVAILFILLQSWAHTRMLKSCSLEHGLNKAYSSHQKAMNGLTVVQRASREGVRRTESGVSSLIGSVAADLDDALPLQGYIKACPPYPPFHAGLLVGLCADSRVFSPIGGIFWGQNESQNKNIASSQAL